MDNYSLNKRKRAVALAYQAGKDPAPRVVAKGEGLIAEEILLRAKEAGIYVHQSPELLSLLVNLNLDDHIPPQLYRVVAELLSWIYKLEKKVDLETVTRPSTPDLTQAIEEAKRTTSPKQSEKQNKTKSKSKTPTKKPASFSQNRVNPPTKK